MMNDPAAFTLKCTLKDHGSVKTRASRSKAEACWLAVCFAAHMLVLTVSCKFASIKSPSKIHGHPIMLLSTSLVNALALGTAIAGILHH